MHFQERIEALRTRHQKVEGQLHELQQSPSTEDNVINELKRQKLALKDEISKLEHSTH